MRPIAAPDTALRCRDSVGARDGTAICIRWWSTLGVSVGARQLHPRATLVDKCTDFAEQRMVHSIRLRDVGEMIKYNRRGNPFFEDRNDLQDFGGRALIWICQPWSLIRLESGSSIWAVVAPAWAKLKRMPRTPSACMRLSSSVDTASLTTATI